MLCVCATQAVLADVANGLQLNAFEKHYNEQVKVERAARSAAAASPPETRGDNKRVRNKIKGNGTRHAEAHIQAAHVALQHPALQRWMAQHPESIARSFLAAQGVTAEEIVQIEQLFRAEALCFSSSAIHGLMLEDGLAEFRKAILANSPATGAPSPPAAASSASFSLDGIEVAVDLGVSFNEATGATSSAGSAGTLTRQRSQESDAGDDGHRLKRSARSKMSSKGPGP